MASLGSPTSRTPTSTAAAPTAAQFVLQASTAGVNALGGEGGDKGVGGIIPSAEIVWNIYGGYGGSMVGYSTGRERVAATLSTTDGGVNMTTAGAPTKFTVRYDGASTLALSTTQNGHTWSHTFTNVDLSAALGNPASGLAYVGFTGADGAFTSTQQISSFSFRYADHNGATLPSDAESLLAEADGADHAKPAGAKENKSPSSDPAAMEDALTLLIRKNPRNVALYRQRAELRARYEHKWSEAAEDLAKAIELKPDDLGPWHHRTMLLGKLRQQDLLAEHLAKMLAKFQDSVVIYSLSTFPTGRPELIQGGELLAAKATNARYPYMRFVAALAHYRAGKYEQAESVFSSAAAEAGGSLPDMRDWPYGPSLYQAVHAMIKARLNDRQAASALLATAREAFKTSMLADHGTEHGDYGEHWWDRLGAEALLGEAESLVNGRNPPPTKPERPQSLPLHSIPWWDARQNMSANIAQTGVSADGKLFFGAGDAGPTGAIRIFEVATGKQVQELLPGKDVLV